MAGRNNIPQYLPTPEEIRQACWKIQEGWSELERLKRAGKFEGPAEDYDGDPWQPPLINLIECLGSGGKDSHG